MAPQRVTQKPPVLLQPPDRETNLAKAQLMIAQTWELLPGPPLNERVAQGYALCLLEIAETWEKAEKLMELIRKGCAHRPVPIEMRRFYCEQIGEPADGLKDWDVDQSEFMTRFGRKAEA